MFKKIALLTAIVSLVSSGFAATQYWDIDGSTSTDNTTTGVGLGGAGSGNWSTAVNNWWDGASGTLGPWVEGNDAVFFGTAGWVSLSGPRTANSLTFKTTGYFVTNSTLTLTGSAIFDVQTGSSQVGPTLLGTVGYNKNGAGTLVLTNAASSITGPVAINGGILDITTGGRIGGTGVGSGNVTINGGTLQNDDAGLANSFLTANRSLIVGASGATLSIPVSSQILVYSGNISGAGNILTMKGPGEFRAMTNSTISTAGHNTFAKLVVDSGIFTLGTSSTGAAEDTLGAVPSVTTDDAITLKNGGALRGNVYSLALDTKRGITLGTGGGTIRNVTGTLTIPGAIKGIGNNLTVGISFDTAAVTLSSVNNSYGKTIVAGGTLNISSDANLGPAPASFVSDQLKLSGGAISFTSTSVDIATNRGINLTAAVNLAVSSSQAPSIESIISGTGPLSKISSGNINLNGTNTFTGGLTITGGGVRFNNDRAAGTGPIIVSPLSIITLRQLSPPGPAAVTITNAITLNANAGNDIDLTAAAGNTFVLSGPISGVGYATRGRGVGASGNIVLSGNNSAWSGGVYWGRGILTLGHKNALGTGALTSTNLVAGESNILASATALTGANAVGNAVNLTGLLIVGGASDLELSGALTLAAGVNTITNLDTGAFSLSGAIGGAGALTVAGSSVTVLSGAAANNYGGATIVNGSLDVRKDGGLSTGNVTVNNGATLKLGSGVNNTYIASGANLLLNGSAAVNLAFTGTPNTINALSFDGGTTFKAPGTWGAIGSGAAHQDARFSGTGLLNVTTGPTSSTALATSANPSTYGALTFTATVTGSAGTPTGTVTFFDGVTTLGTSPLVAGVATFNANSLGVAGSPHSITAVYPTSDSIAGSTSSAVSQTVNPATLTATVLVSSKTYDGHVPATITNRSLAGIIGSDDVNLGTSGFATFSNIHVGVGKTVTITGLALSGAAAGNYTLASTTVTTTADITAVVLTVSGLSATDKPSDANTTATVTGTPALVGIVAGDDVSLAGTATGTFNNKNVGTAKPVTVAGLSLTGSASSDYLLAATILSASITSPTLTVTGITAADKPYDGTNTATLNVAGATLVGVSSGNDVTLVTSNAVGVFESINVADNITVDISGLTIVGADAAAYTLTQPTTTASIKYALSVAGMVPANKVYDGTTSATVDFTSAALVGIQGSDVVTLGSGSAVNSFINKNVGTGKPITVGGLTLGGADAGKYLLVAITTNANITAAGLTVTGLSAQDKTYDGTAIVTISGTPALSGLVGSDAISLTGSASGSFGDKNVGTAKPVSVSGLSITGADAGNYTLTQPTLSASIAPASLTVTGLSAVSKTYNAGTGAAITGTPALNGVIGLDDVSASGSATGSFSTKTIGIGKPVAVSGLSLAGTDAGNYALTPLILSANITAATVQLIGVQTVDRVYDGTVTDALTGTPGLSGVQGTDSLSLAGTPAGAFADKNVGAAKPVTISGLSLAGSDAGNYLLSVPILSASITFAPLTVTGLAASNKGYDGTNTATITGTPALSGVIGSDDVSLTGTAAGTFNDKTVGTAKSVTVTGLSTTGADAGNYALTLPTLSANLTAGALTITGLSATSRVYDTTTNAAITGTTALSGIQPGDVVTLSGTAAGSFASKTVGVSKPVAVSGLTLSGADAGNYTLTPLTLTADITTAPLTLSGITADNKVYDGTNTATFSGTGVLSGVLSGDTVTLGGTPGGSFSDKTVGIGKSVGFVGVFPTGADAANYNLNLQLLSADITPAPLTVTGLSATSKVYDATTAAAETGTPALAGVIGSDDVTLSGTASGAFNNKNVGVAKPVTVSGLTKTGADAGNYTLTLPTLSASITLAPLTVTGLSAVDKVYDTTTAASLAGTPALSGVFGGDVVTLAGTASGSFAHKNVGVGKSVSVSGLTTGGADAGNYALSLPTLTASITVAPLTVTGLSASNKGYDATTTATVTGTPVLSGVLGGDVVSLTGTASGAFNNKSVGAAKPVTVSGLGTTGADAGNYALTLPTLSASITAAPLSISGLAASDKVYDSTTSATITGTPSLVGVIGSDVVSLTGTAAGTFNTKNVGVLKAVTVSGLSTTGADAGNYTLTLPTLSAAITTVPLTVTGLSASNKVYDGTTAATITGTPALAGVQGSDVVSASGTPSGTFADKNVGTGKVVTVTGLTLAGADAPNYTLTQPSLTANITALATVNSLVTTTNYAALGSNVTFTATLAGSPAATDSPSGSVVFLANGTPFSTNALASGVASASSTTLPLGTNVVSAQYAGDANFNGSTNSLQQVIYNPVTCSQVNTMLGILDNANGTFTLTFQGTPQAQYYVRASADISVSINSWPILSYSTNTVTNTSGLWNLTVTNAGPVQFYRSAAVVPCQ